jgi:hypothetical protein
VADRQFVAKKASGDAEETDQRTDGQDGPGLRGNTSLVRCAEGEKDNDPLPQSEEPQIAAA